MQAKKSLGQHFLMHPATAERIAHVAELTPLDVVLEIGPGTGALTRSLLTRATKVIAVEADAGLAKALEETFAEEIQNQTFELHFGDIRTFPLELLPSEYVVVANIPYYLTGEILRMFLTTENQPKAMTLLVQKEVAERVVARPKSPSTHAQGKESLLSLSVKVYGTPRYAFTVPKGAFIPAPKVDSAILTIKDISRRRFASEAHEARFFELIRAGFAHKRKMLGGNLKELAVELTPTLQKKRSEDLTLDEWLALAKT